MVLINFVFSLYPKKQFDILLSRGMFNPEKASHGTNKKYLRYPSENYKKLLHRNRKLYFVSEHVFLRNNYNNIISKQSANIIYRKHVLDSLTLMPFFKSFWYNKKTKTCLDFGTGGGFPGLVISIFFPEIFISLLDSIEKKTIFHRGTLGIIRSSNCNSICLRGERLNYSINHLKKYDLVLSRAVANLGLLIELSKTLIKSTGMFVAMKKIRGCGKEINDTIVFPLKTDVKIKCLVKVDTKRSGKVLFIFKKF